jgi:methyl-accepting chemotaxis protein
MAQTADLQPDVRRLYEAAEGELSRAAEKAVDTESFASLLGLVTSNVVAISRIATTTFDLTLRNLRLAGRRDIVRLATQLNRTEDKLEHVLAELEDLRADLASSSNSRSAGSRRRSTTSRNGKS